MPTRMDRYNNSEEKKFSRSDRNKDLYENLGNNTRYTNITDVTNANAIDLTEAEKNTNTREGYHQVKEFRNVEPVPRVKKELDDFNFLYQNRENRIYNVNRVLEEARKNRKDIDEKEEKRKLKDNSYNIVTSLTKEELEKYRQNRENKTRTEEEEKIHDLIDTIASKTLAGELDKATSVDLLSDLMATNILDRVNITPENKEEVSSPEAKLELSKEVLDKDQIEEIKKVATESKTDENSTGADSDFYTKSMDLSSEDFEVDPEFQEKKMPIILKIFLILLVVSALIIAGYFIWKNFS